jgi:glycosyltransferase involved in cell wall biosynthesis
VRDIAGALVRHDPVLLGVRGVPIPMVRGRVEPLFYQPNEGFGLAATPALRLAARLASGRRGDLWHFVFAPNVRTSRTARALSRLRRVPTVQTVASVPKDDEDLGASLFGDRVVVLSRRTEQQFLARGVSPGRVRRIPPCVAPVIETPDMRMRGRRAAGLPADAPIVLFPGDLERDRGARLTMEAFAAMPRSLGAMLVVAARRKTHRSAEAERALRQRAGELGLGDRVRWVGETAYMHALLAASDVVALPATDLIAKVDLPIVLLEALSLGVPVVVARGSSAEDLADGEGALAITPDRDALSEVLTGIVSDTQARSTQSESARRAYERYRPRVVASAYEALYDEVLR